VRSVSIDDKLARVGFCVDTGVSVGTHPGSHRHQGLEILLIHVGDIVASVGFGSVSGFERAFQRCTGLSVSEYRRGVGMHRLGASS